MLRLSLMLLTIVVGAQTAGAEEGTPGRTASAGPSDRARPSSGANWSRRAKRGGKRTGKMVGWLAPEKALLAEEPAKPSGDLRIYSVNYKDEANVNIYNPDGSYNVQALAEIGHIFKCRRSGLEHDIDTRLITILSHIHDHFGGRRIEILSGYRFQRRTSSNHFHGTAADFRVPGVPTRKVRDFVEALDAGGMGVGWYPKVDFIHVDIRQSPSYRWIDYSRSNPDARDRLPPRGFKRKNPES
jgi:uncharacterized protein YcbK (DUF882 family)